MAKYSHMGCTAFQSGVEWLGLIRGRCKMVEKIGWKIGFGIALIPTSFIMFLLLMMTFKANAPPLIGFFVALIIFGFPLLVCLLLNIFLGLRAFRKGKEWKTDEKVLLATFSIFLLLIVAIAILTHSPELEPEPLFPNGENWHEVSTFMGKSDNQTTDTFTVEEEYWRIRYIINATEKEDIKYCSFNAVVKTIDHQDITWKYSGCGKKSCESTDDMTSFAGAGEYYIMLTTKNVQNWKIVVEECESANG